jgi:hypothetical protein
MEAPPLRLGFLEREFSKHEPATVRHFAADQELRLPAVRLTVKLQGAIDPLSSLQERPDTLTWFRACGAEAGL